jgi:hypothetical protein
MQCEKFHRNREKSLVLSPGPWFIEPKGAPLDGRSELS